MWFRVGVRWDRGAGVPGCPDFPGRVASRFFISLSYIADEEFFFESLAGCMVFAMQHMLPEEILQSRNLVALHFYLHFHDPLLGNELLLLLVDNSELHRQFAEWISQLMF